ncbi:MAG: biopolymer transport protein ExbD [Pirellulaceae bacterium]|jgi:biopolymer transport protein ExbD
MRLNKKRDTGIQEGDLTPMIDMTFQLIAFFMVLINFSQSEQDERVQLPESELAKPAEGPLEYPITLHLLEDGDDVIMGGQRIPIASLGVYLNKEITVINYEGLAVSDATIVIRAHKDAPTGKVQALIAECQKNTFEKFALRAKEDVGNN